MSARPLTGLTMTRLFRIVGAYYAGRPVRAVTGPAVLGLAAPECQCRTSVRTLYCNFRPDHRAPPEDGARGRSGGQSRPEPRMSQSPRHAAPGEARSPHRPNPVPK